MHLSGECSKRRLLPSQPSEDCAAHHPLLVFLREEFELLREMRDPLPVGGFGEGIGEVGSPIAALWPERIETALEVLGHVPPRIWLQRVRRRRGQLDGYVGVFRECYNVVDGV